MANSSMTQRQRQAVSAPRRGLFLAFAAVTAAFLSYVGWLAHANLEREKLAAREKVAIGAVALEEQASRAFGEIELLLESFSDLCDGRRGDTPEGWLAAHAARAVGTVPQLAFVALYGRDGRALLPPAHAPAPRARHDGFDPEHFELTDTNRKRSHIGRPFRAGAGGPRFIPVSVRLMDDAGALCAVAIAGVSVDYFEQFFRSFLGTQDGVVLLRREQRGVLVRIPAAAGPIDLGPRPEEPGRFGVQWVVSPIDGVVRVGAYRKSERFPLVVRFALTERAITERWLRATLQTTLPGVGVLLLLLGSALWIDRLLQQGRQREQALAAANEGLRQARREAEEASEAKSRFLANMSHEIRTPLNTLVGLGELLQGTGLDERQRGYVLKLKTASVALLGLVDTILDLSKAETGHLELEQTVLDLPALLREVTELAACSAQRKGLAVRLMVDDALPAALVGDPIRLRQILTNLIANAVKFTDAGAVTVAADVVAADEWQVAVRLAVRDTGIGMTDGQMERVFEMFAQADASTTRRFGGTGLGLAISQRIAQAMGTQISVESAVGVGSTFALTLSLPRGPGPHEPGPASLPAADALAGMSVLLVDDDLLGREIEKDLLEAIGAEVRVAATGAEAVVLSLAGERFDVILMDVQTPEMDGLEATRRIRGGPGGRVPIIGLSANALESEAQRARTAGMDDYLTKPIDLERLVATIRHHIQHQERVIP